MANFITTHDLPTQFWTVVDHCKPFGIPPRRVLYSDTYVNREHLYTAVDEAESLVIVLHSKQLHGIWVTEDVTGDIINEMSERRYNDMSDAERRAADTGDAWKEYR